MQEPEASERGPRPRSGHRRRGRTSDPLRHVLPDPLNPIRTFRIMGRLVRRVIKKPGAPPGTLVHTGERHLERPRIRVLNYDAHTVQELETERPTDCVRFRDAPGVAWIDVEGIHEPALVEELGGHFGLHPLVMEDILHVGQRPKVEEYDGYLFIELNMLHVREGTLRVEDEQLSLAVGKGWILTFRERPGNVLDGVRERLRSGKGRIRTKGADYLAYAIIDSVVDSYFSVLESVGTQVEALEEEAMDRPGPPTMHRIHDLRREMIVIRRSVWPVRDLMASLLRMESGIVAEGTRVFLRDVYDHAVQLIDTVENLRDLVGGLMDLYLSSVSNRTNEVMKVLTVIATIFIPLTFIAGVYGMNFEFMPELGWRWGYPAVLALMLAVALGMLAYFRRQGWF